MTDEQWNALYITLFVLLLLLFFFGLAMYWPSNEVVVEPDVPRSVLIVDERNSENLYNYTPTPEGRREWPQPATLEGRRGRERNTEREPPMSRWERASSLNAFRAPRDDQMMTGSAPTTYRMFGTWSGDNTLTPPAPLFASTESFDSDTPMTQTSTYEYLYNFTPTPQALPETNFSGSPSGSQSAQETQRQESTPLESFAPTDRDKWKQIRGKNYFRPTKSSLLRFEGTDNPYLAAEGSQKIPGLTNAEANKALFSGKQFLVKVGKPRPTKK